MTTSTNVMAARLPDGRLLIAILDPAVPDRYSPLRHHLRNEATSGRRGTEGTGIPKSNSPSSAGQ